MEMKHKDISLEKIHKTLELEKQYPDSSYGTEYTIPALGFNMIVNNKTSTSKYVYPSGKKRKIKNSETLQYYFVTQAQQTNVLLMEQIGLLRKILKNSSKTGEL